MKYLKLFEDKITPGYQNELEELIPQLDDLCQDLKDHGFTIKYWLANTLLADFPKGSILKSFTYFPNPINGLIMKIDYVHKIFDIGNIIESLLFIESYAKDELDLNINFCYFEDLEFRPNKYYCKNIESLPNNISCSNFQICFIKA